MTESLYRKYRPQTFADVVGQDAIERTLRNALAQNKVSHAYLFCGPRGTGKTTTARLMAKAILCDKGVTPDPDGTCESCKMIAEGRHPDVYELDAASRTGVDNVREEIIGRVNFAPTVGRAKIYIIDEVHMLSTAAFNALLKTLEEPPDHVVFILCTTDPNKVPATIHSRCQRFDFHRISVDQIVARLGAVCVAEEVEFEPEALELIAERSDGGMRNALTSLEQLIVFSEGKVTRQAAEDLLGSLDSSDMAEIIGAIGRRDAAACFLWLAQFVETGADLAQFARDLTEHIRALYVLSLMGEDAPLEVSDGERAQLLRELPYFGSDRLARALMILGDLINELRTSGNARLSFEIALTRLVHPSSDLTLESLAERIEVLERALAGISKTAVGSPVAVSANPAPAASTPTDTLRAPQATDGFAAPQASTRARQDGSAGARLQPRPAKQPDSAARGAASVVQTERANAANGAVGAHSPNGHGSVAASGPGSGSPAVANAAARARAAAQAAAARAKARMQNPQDTSAGSTAAGGRPASAASPRPAVHPASANSPASGFGQDFPGVYEDGFADVPDDYLPAEAMNQPLKAVVPSPAPVASRQPARPVAAQRTGQAAPAPSATPAAPQQAAPSAPVSGELRDTLANAAALQRGWQTTMAALKKHKAAFGVLFMNTQVSAKPDQGVIVVTFPATNKFAYMSVRKPEVYSALEEATEKGFGTSVTVQFEQDGQASAPVSAPAPVASEPQGARAVETPARRADASFGTNGEVPRPVSVNAGANPSGAAASRPAAPQSAQPGQGPQRRPQVASPAVSARPKQQPEAPANRDNRPAPGAPVSDSAPSVGLGAAGVSAMPSGKGGGDASEEDEFASALAAGFGAGISFEEVPDPDNGGPQ